MITIFLLVLSCLVDWRVNADSADGKGRPLPWWPKRHSKLAIVPVSYSMPTTSIICRTLDSFKLPDLLERASRGTEVLSGKMFPSVSVRTFQAQLGPQGCKVDAFVAAVMDELGNIGVDNLHLYSHLALVAPAVMDQCQWGMLAEYGCAPTPLAGNGPCVMIVKDCAPLHVFARNWGTNQAFVRLDRFWSDRGPLSFGSDPSGVGSECLLAESCHFAPTELLRMNYVPPWRVRWVTKEQGPASFRIPLASLERDPFTLPLSVPQLIVVVHPITQAQYVVSIVPTGRHIAIGLKPVLVHSMRSLTSMLLHDLSFEGPVFTDIGSEFSIAQVSPLSSDNSCWISIVFGCFVGRPDWKLLASPLGYIGDVPVYERSNLRFRLSSSSSGTCLPSVIDLNLKSSMYNIAPFQMQDGRVPNIAGVSNLSMTLFAGQSCVAETFLSRASSHSPPGMDESSEIVVNARTQNGESNVRKLIVGDIGKSCWSRVGSFDVTRVTMTSGSVGTSAGFFLTVEISSMRKYYCSDAGDVEVSVLCDGNCGKSAVLSDVSGNATIVMFVDGACCFDAALMNLTLSRRFGDQTFVRRGVVKQLKSCSANAGLDFTVHSPRLNDSTNLTTNLTVFDPATFAFFVTIHPSSCDVNLWQWVLMEQLRVVLADKNQFPAYPDTADFMWDVSANTTETWKIGSSVVNGVEVHLDRDLHLSPRTATVVMIRSSVEIVDFNALASNFVIDFNLTNTRDGSAIAEAQCQFRKVFKESDGSCVRVLPKVWSWCMQDRQQGGSVPCRVQIMNADTGRCPFTRFTVAILPLEADSAFLSIRDGVIPSIGDLVGNISVTLSPRSVRAWDVTARLRSASATVFPGVVATVYSEFHTPPQSDSSEVIHLSPCQEGPLLIEGLQAQYSASLRQTIAISARIRNSASFSCSFALTVKMVPSDASLASVLLFNVSTQAYYFLNSANGFVDIVVGFSPWQWPETLLGKNVLMVLVVETTTAGTQPVFRFPFSISVIRDVCIPGPAIIHVESCSQQGAFFPEQEGRSLFCGSIKSGDQGSCEKVAWNASLYWDVPDPDPVGVYGVSASDWNAYFYVESVQPNSLFSAVDVQLGEMVKFNISIVHRQEVKAGDYRHVLRFSQSSVHVARNVLIPFFVPVRIACPRPGVVNRVRVESYTPIFSPLVTVNLRWIKPCGGLCCRGVVSSIYRNDVLIAQNVEDEEFEDWFQRRGVRNRYRIETWDAQGRKSPGPNEACNTFFDVVVEQTLWDLLSFLMLLSGLIVFSGLVVLIIVLIHKTRKIDLEIGRLQKVAEMHELGMIEGSVDVEPKTPARRVRDDDEEEMMVKALEDFPASGPDELPFVKGDMIRVIRRNNRTGWWRGEIGGVSGLFPESCVRVMPHSLPNTPATKEKKRWGDDFE